jgi:hypothetical protein
VKKRLTIGIAATLLATTVSLVAAGGSDFVPVTAADALPAYEILASVRSLGFNPITRAVRRGSYYVLHAVDPRGDEVRMVADAQLGDIVSITRVLAPRYNGGPRIIHVPSEDDTRVGVEDRDDEIASPDDDGVGPAAPPRRGAINRPQQRSDAPPRQHPYMLSAPPRAQELSPIYPTPKFGANGDRSEKFFAPDEASMPSSVSREQH